jgi:anti-sigma B factor antagonist
VESFDVIGSDGGLSVATAKVGFRTVFEVRGELDVATVGTLAVAVEAALQSAEREVWIDLSRVSFMSSAGVHLLTRVRRELELDGRTLAVICPPGPARRVLEVSGVAPALSLFDSRAVAQRALS